MSIWNQALKEAFNWGNKWFLSSVGGLVTVLTFFLKSVGVKTWSESILYGLILCSISILIMTVIKYRRIIDEQYIQEAEKLKDEATNNLNYINLLKAEASEKDASIDSLKNELEDRSNKLFILEGNLANIASDNNYKLYGNAIIVLSEMFSKFHAIRKKTKLEERELRETLEYMCNKIKQIFEHNNKSDSVKLYSVCIKLFVFEAKSRQLLPELRIATLCRDEKSIEARRAYSKGEHHMYANTCFLEVYRELKEYGRGYYFNNRIPIDIYYANSSALAYGRLPDKNLSNDERRKRWPLPYRSELVVPLSPLLGSGNKLQFIGYLCVDCNEEDGFNVQYDPGMLQGVADGIFDLVKRGVDKGIFDVIKQIK